MGIERNFKQLGLILKQRKSLKILKLGDTNRKEDNSRCSVKNVLEKYAM